MTITVPGVRCAEAGREEEVQEIAVVETPRQRIEPLGSTLAEAKSIFTTLQQQRVERHATACVAAHAQCEHGGKALGIQAYHTRTVCTRFGRITLASPGLSPWRCQRRTTTTCRPWNALRTDAVAPELLCMEPKWAALSSDGLTAQALQDFRPVDATRKATPIHNQALAEEPLAA